MKTWLNWIYGISVVLLAIIMAWQLMGTVSR